MLWHVPRLLHYIQYRKRHAVIDRILDISVLTWIFRYWTVRDLDGTIFLTDHNCLVLINCQYFCTSSSLIYMNQKFFDNSSVDRSRRSLFYYTLIFIYIFIILTFASDYLISPMYESSSP